MVDVWRNLDRHALGAGLVELDPLERDLVAAEEVTERVSGRRRPRAGKLQQVGGAGVVLGEKVFHLVRTQAFP